MSIVLLLLRLQNGWFPNKADISRGSGFQPRLVDKRLDESRLEAAPTTQSLMVYRNQIFSYFYSNF